MNGYRKINYGYVNATLMEPSVLKIAGILKSYVIAGKDDLDPRCDPNGIKEVIQLTKTLIGPDFNGWLKVNYDNGKGVRSRLVRGIILYLNGKISGRSLVQMVKQDENYVTVNNAKVVVRSSQSDNKSYDEIIDLLKKVNNGDYYKLLVGLGPDYFARMFLSFSGDSAYVNK